MAANRDTYSASVLEVATQPCRFEAHEVAVPSGPARKVYSLVDFRVPLSPAQSGSEYPRSLRVPSPCL